jgi:hypothetical protein
MELAALMPLAASSGFAFNLSDAANAVSAMQHRKQQGQVQAPEAQANLLNTLQRIEVYPRTGSGRGGSDVGVGA